MKKNSVILLLGRVNAASANHDIREFSIRIYNSVDMLPHTQGEFNSDEVKDYAENETLEKILENLRDNIQVCYHAHGVTETIKEEEGC